jgi:hypothetical protein
MADVYYGRTVTVTDERVREAVEKQERQRKLREELDSQRAQQRELRVASGIGTSDEPMTRAQRHRARMAREQEEERLKAGGGLDAYGSFGGTPITPIYGAAPGYSAPFQPPFAAGTQQPGYWMAQQPQDAFNGTYNRPQVAVGGYGQAPPLSLHSPTTNGSPSVALPPIHQNGSFSPRGDAAWSAPDESIYGWHQQPQPMHHPGPARGVGPSGVAHPPTPPQQLPGGAYQRVPIPVAVTRDEVELNLTLSRAPPPNASQDELAAWLSRATEQIRQARGESFEQPEAETRGRGPATRGAKVRSDAIESSDKRATSSNARTRAPSNQRDRGDQRVAKLEATLAGQLEEMRRMREKQRQWEDQVSSLKGELKNARVKEKHLSKAVMKRTPSTTQPERTTERRAETAPKGLQGAKSREASNSKRPITAGNLDPIEDERTTNLPPIPAGMKASYQKKKQALPSPRPAQNDDPARAPSPKVQRKVEPPLRPSATAMSPTSVAVVSFAQLLQFTENKLLSHKQAQQLWEVFNGHRAPSQQQHGGNRSQDEDFDAMDTFETYEDLADDE